MPARPCDADHVHPWVLYVVITLVALLSASLLAGVGLFAAGQPRLLVSVLGALAVVTPMLKVPLALLAPARAFDRRRSAAGGGFAAA